MVTQQQRIASASKPRTWVGLYAQHGAARAGPGARDTRQRRLRRRAEELALYWPDGGMICPTGTTGPGSNHLVAELYEVGIQRSAQNSCRQPRPPNAEAPGVVTPTTYGHIIRSAQVERADHGGIRCMTVSLLSATEEGHELILLATRA